MSVRITEERLGKIADALHDGESAASDLARAAKLSIQAVRALLAELIRRGEVETRTPPDRSGEPGRFQMRYSLKRTKRKAA